MHEYQAFGTTAAGLAGGECPQAFEMMAQHALGSTPRIRNHHSRLGNSRSLRLDRTCCNRSSVVEFAQKEITHGSVAVPPRGCRHVTVLPCHAMPCRAVPCHAVLCRAVSPHPVLVCARPRVRASVPPCVRASERPCVRPCCVTLRGVRRVVSLRLCTSLRCVLLCYIEWRCAVLHCVALSCVVLRCVGSRRTALRASSRCIASCHVASRRVTLHHIASRRGACASLRCVALHWRVASRHVGASHC